MCCRETIGSIDIYNRGQHMHGLLSNSTLLGNCRNHSNIQVFNNLVLHMQVLLSEVLTHCSTLFAYGEMSCHEYQSSQETQKDCQDKEISDKKQQDLCLHNEEDISSLQDGTNYYTLPFLFLCPIFNIEKIFMHILIFRPFQSSSLMITSQTTSMVRRRGRFSYNTHGSILKCS